MPLLWPGLWHHRLPLQARGGEVPRPAGGEHGRVQEEASAEVRPPEVPAPGGGEEGQGQDCQAAAGEAAQNVIIPSFRAFRAKTFTTVYLTNKSGW